MTRWRGASLTESHDDAGGSFCRRWSWSFVGGTLLVMLRGLGKNRQQNIGRQRTSGISALPLPHFLKRLLLKLSGLFFDCQLWFQTRAPRQVGIQFTIKT